MRRHRAPCRILLHDSTLVPPPHIRTSSIAEAELIDHPHVCRELETMNLSDPHIVYVDCHICW